MSLRPVLRLAGVGCALALGCGTKGGFVSSDGALDGAGAAGGDAAGQAAPSCGDGVRNGAEADVDCGGGCPACADGRGCGGDGECLSLACIGGHCASASCDDGRLNGGETDVDCGGGCPACAVCRLCAASQDCETGLCESGLCEPTITIVSATYAANCGAATAVPTIGAACNQQQSCDYLFNYTVDIGSDPAYGCYKDLRVEYTCSGSDTTQEFYESCAPCDPQNTPTAITLDLFCEACLGIGLPPD